MVRADGTGDFFRPLRQVEGDTGNLAGGYREDIQHLRGGLSSHRLTALGKPSWIEAYTCDVEMCV